jgi:hypothetical protein
MTGTERFDDAISRWLEETAPNRLPGRVLEATFERTRRTRQAHAWRAALARRQLPRFVPALGAAAVVMATIVALNAVPLLGPAGTPAPSPSAPASPSASPGSTSQMWPQTTLEEVRAAQKLADAGDPLYAWQRYLDPGQLGQNHPCPGSSAGCWRGDGNGGIFRRFLEERLGWTEYSWVEAFAHRDGLVPGDVIFVRCAAGGANPSYPDDPARCGPTIDELRYETVKIHVSQPDVQGGSGIWVVTGWELIEPAEQVRPPSDADIAASLGAFLQARIDGRGAEAFADFAEFDQLADERVDREIPLLYATSTGAGYVRSEFEVMAGPAWPDGRMRLKVRLFTAKDATVVEQLFALERGESGRWRVVYDFQPVVAADEVPATTENGTAVPVTYGFLDGEVTYRAAFPLGPSRYEERTADRLAVEGLLPADDAPRRILTFLADPLPLGPDCVADPAPANAEAFARIVGEDPTFETNGPTRVTIGGRPALRMDLARVPGSRCPLLLEPNPMASPGRLSNDGRVRLYLLDLPGEPVRVLAIVVTADADSFETVLGWAAPVIESIEFRAR